MPDPDPTILVADDDEVNRALFAEVLGTEGYTVRLAEDGRAALEAMRGGSADLVLLDLAMPEMDGYAVLAARQADAALRAIPVVVLSGDDEPEAVARCTELGAVACLAKPVDFGALFDALPTWLSSGAVGEAAEPAVPPAPSLPGIDADEALGRLRLSPEGFERVLARFADTLPGLLDELDGAVAAGDPAGLHAVAHKVAGTAGNVGASALREAARALERAARAGKGDLDALAAAVTERAQEVLAGIGAIGPAPRLAEGAVERAVSAADGEFASAALGPLVAALDDGDWSGAAEALDTLVAHAPQPLAGELAQMRRRMDDYDFEGAADLARGMQARLGEREGA